MQGTAVSKKLETQLQAPLYGPAGLATYIIAAWEKSVPRAGPELCGLSSMQTVSSDAEKGLSNPSGIQGTLQRLYSNNDKWVRKEIGERKWERKIRDKGADGHQD